MLEGDGRIMFRFPRRLDAARSLGIEARLLEFLGRHLSARIPAPELIATLAKPKGWPFLAYRKLPGLPLTDLSSLRAVEKGRLTRFLVRLFSELASVPRAPLRRLGLRPGDRPSWREEYRRLERRYRRVGARFVPTDVDRELTHLFAAFGEALGTSHYVPVLLHNDLWPSHILWDPPEGRPTGVIDWEDARFGDPAFDLAALGGLGEPHLTALRDLRRAPGDRAFDERLLFYRRVLPVRGLLFGLETGQRAIFRAEMRRLRSSVWLGSPGAG
jgi:aminoglycoside 2''-phosphotransferase